MDFKIDLENTFGIKKFNETFEFDKYNRIYDIYASNGVMKSSLYKVFNCIKINKIDEIKDNIDNTLTPKVSITFDNKPITGENIIIYNGEEVDNKKVQKSLIVSSKYSEKMVVADKDVFTIEDILYDILAKKVYRPKKKPSAKNISDIKDEIKNIFETNGFEFLSLTGYDEIDISSIEDNQILINEKYNDLTNDKVSKVIDDNNDVLDDFVIAYEKIIKKSIFLTTDLTLEKYNNIKESLDTNFFFSQKNKLVLRFDTDEQVEIKSIEDFENFIERERIKINSFSKEQFKTISSNFQKNKESKYISNVIIKYPALISELLDIKALKKKLIKYYLKDDNELIQKYKEAYFKRLELHEKILSEFVKEKNIWEKTVEEFNSRFDVPFRVELDNKEGLLDSKILPKFKFSFFDGVTKFDKEKSFLQQNVLSKGENNALNFLSFIFEMKSAEIRSQNNPIFVILDDVVESFDYKNKFAFIQYLFDMTKSNNNIYIISLTHNFDLYRTIASRVCSNRSFAKMARKNSQQIILSDGNYLGNICLHFIKQLDITKNQKQITYILAILPFLREIMQMKDISEPDLTEYFHYKENTCKVDLKEVILQINTNFGKNIEPTNFSDTYINYLKNECSFLANEGSPLDNLLEYKIIFSLGIRIKAEAFMVNKYNSDEWKKIEKNQTRELFKYVSSNNLIKESEKKLLNKVLIETPSMIHLNAFMYEPLIDVDIQEYISLYDSISKL